jgi:hypothetical protein
MDCAASLRGCKHVIALLAWLSRCTEESAPTEVQCFWNKAKLLRVGSSIKFIPVKDLGKLTATPSVVKHGNLLADIVSYVDSNSIDVESNLLRYQ